MNSIEREPTGGSMRLVRSEDLEVRLRTLLREAEDAGRQAEQEAMRAGKEARRLPQKPDFREETLRELAQILEDEIVVARPAAGEAVIEETEEEREIAKRALIHLKLPQLRRMAADLGLTNSGHLEDVVDRIARNFPGDQEAIARLIVKYETDPPPERRFTTRVFQVRESSTAFTIPKRLELFIGRYIRTGIARWFVFDSVDVAARHLVLSGTYRFYNADAEKVEDDEYRLHANRATATAQLFWGLNDRLVNIDAKGVSESRAMMSAFQRAAALRWSQALSLPAKPRDGELADWDPVSVLMADFVQSQFRSSSIEVLNLVMVGFETGDQPTSTGTVPVPSVRAVRFQGRHLLDSQTACELLSDGQSLIQIASVVRFKAGSEADYVLPVSIKFERDHFAVMTGFGSHPPNIARQLHDLVVNGIRTSLSDGLDNPRRMAKVAAEIRERAGQVGPVARATIFGPSSDEDHQEESHIVE